VSICGTDIGGAPTELFRTLWHGVFFYHFFISTSQPLSRNWKSIKPFPSGISAFLINMRTATSANKTFGIYFSAFSFAKSLTFESKNRRLVF
jgi:hypothetical protein